MGAQWRHNSEGDEYIPAKNDKWADRFMEVQEGKFLHTAMDFCNPMKLYLDLGRSRATVGPLTRGATAGIRTP